MKLIATLVLLTIVSCGGRIAGSTETPGEEDSDASTEAATDAGDACVRVGGYVDGRYNPYLPSAAFYGDGGCP
jgi:hypothetical protein